MSQPMANEAQELPCNTAETVTPCEVNSTCMPEADHSCVVETVDCVKAMVEPDETDTKNNSEPASEPPLDTEQEEKQEGDAVGDDAEEESQPKVEGMKEEEDGKQKHPRSEDNDNNADNDDDGAASKRHRIEGTVRDSTGCAAAGRAPTPCTEDELTKASSANVTQGVADGTEELPSQQA